MPRIHVVGLSGSGKSTLCRSLASTVGIPHIELDALYHGPDWTPTPRDWFRAVVREHLSADNWVVDGNYGIVRDLVWARADTVVWLDLPRRVVLPALVRRTVGRGLARRRLWNGNVERPWQLFDPRKEHNLLLWALHKHPIHQRSYEAAMVGAEWQHLRFVRLRRREGIRRFVEAAPIRYAVQR